MMSWRRQWIWRVVVVLVWLIHAAATCPYHVGFYNLNSNGSQWAPTVAALEAPDMNGVNCSFTLQPYSKQLDLVQAVVDENIDFVLVNPGLMICLVSQYQVTLIASLINLQRGQQTSVYGGSILVRQNSSIQHIEDLEGRSAISGAPDSTALFQVQAEAVLKAGFNVFENFEVLGFNSNQSVVMLELVQGKFDAAFLRSDMINTVLDAISFPYDSVRAIDTTIISGYPYPVTGGVYPEWSFAALPHVPPATRQAAAASLMSIKPDDPGAVRQKYYGWTVPYNYFPHEVVQRDLGIMSLNGTCIISDDDDYYSYVSCPSGTLKLTKEDVNARCTAYPQCNRDGVVCVCSPCFRPVTVLLIGLSGYLFWFVVAGIWLTIMLTSWFVQATVLNNHVLIDVPMEHLSFPHIPEVIGEGRYGNIIKASVETIEAPFKKPVAVHRLMIGSERGRLDDIFGKPANLHSDVPKRDIWRKASDACRLRHPHILDAEGVVKLPQETLFVTEYPEAGTLYDLIHNQTLKIDMGTALRLLKEVAFAMQYLHSERPPVLHRLSLYNVWLDTNRSALIMLSDNFLPPTKSTAADVLHFGTLMLQVLRQVAPATSIEPHDLQNDLTDPVLLIRDCTRRSVKRRPKMDEILKRLSDANSKWVIEQEEEANSREQKFKQERDLVHAVFPRHVAEALRAGKTVEPESHDCVSILFTDIVGFTSISSRLSPIKVADMLDRLYLQFDALSLEYDIFKIETIGDAYVGVSNLHEKHDDHAARLARFAQRIVQIAQETRVDVDDPSETLTIRVGINTGPVVASVAGTRNPRYCLFGNAVNLASRMESTSTPGRIQLSQTAAELISEQAPDLRHLICPRLDVQNIKGKGFMATSWLTN